MARFWAAVSCALLPLGAWAQLPPPAQPPLPLSVEPPPEAIIAPPAEDSAAIDLALPDLAQVQVLAIDPDRLFAASAWGQRAQALLAELGDEIAAENERLERQFTEEEQALTAARAALAPAEFRRRAEAFDTRAQDVRRDRAEALRALAERAEAERTAFIEAAVPVMAQVMEERGARVLLDRRVVFLADERVDITDDLLARIDAEIGDGAAWVAPPEGGQGQ